jgi:hypothetical protein
MVIKKKGSKKKSSSTTKKSSKPVKKTVKKKTVRKPRTKSSRPKSKTNVKETVRVKTFIVEKPVYVEAPTGRKEPAARARHPDSFQVFDSSDSRYAKDDSKEGSKEDDYSEPAFLGKEDEEGFDDFSEDGSEFDENPDESEEVLKEDGSHIRSRAMFSKVWWKRAFWQASAIWIAIFIFAFFMDFVNLSEVELQRNWAFLFIGIFVITLVYQKYLKGKIVF